MIAKIPLILDPQPEGGYTVTSPVLRGLVTEGDTISEALHNAQDAFQAVVEIYEELGHKLPPGILVDHADDEPLEVEILAPVTVRVPSPVS